MDGIAACVRDRPKWITSASPNLELKAYFWMIEMCSSPLCLNGKLFLTSLHRTRYGTLLGTGTTSEGTKMTYGAFIHDGCKMQGNLQ